MSDFCWWVDCSNEPSHAIRGVNVKPKGAPKEVALGDVYLCPAHFKFASRTGRLNLDPQVFIAAAIEQQDPA